MSSRRLEDLFHVVKVIRRIVDETHGLAERAIQGAVADRALADIGGGAGLHTLCGRLIDERERLATELEHIRHELELVNITPRTENLGAPQPRPIKAGLKRAPKGRA